MRAGERESRIGMIEGRIQPVVGVVTHLAVGGVRLALVVPCIIVLNLMAGEAFRTGGDHAALVAG